MLLLPAPDRMRYSGAMKLGLCLGAVLMLVAGAAYLALLREPRVWFYAFAALVFVASPLIGAVTAVVATHTKRLRNFLAAGSAHIGLALLLFVVAYAVYPEYQRTSVQLPASAGISAAALIHQPALSITCQRSAQPHS